MSAHYEIEAEKLWCPFSRLSAGYQHPAAINRFVGEAPQGDPRIGNALNCMGSRCMAWRFIDPAKPESAGYTAKHGYCGLAGKP